MNAHPQLNFPILVLLVLAVPLAFFFRAYLRIRFLPALGVTLGAAALGAFAMTRRLRHGSPLFERDPIDRVLIPTACVLFTIFVIGFSVRMVRAWIFDDVTEEERRPNSEGVRAWLRGGNLVCALLIPALGWYGFGYSAWALLLIVLLAILARPTVNSLGDGGTSQVDASLSQDRERIMKMLEAGTIQPDEASELLSALAETAPGNATAPTQPAMSGKQRLAILGSLLLLVSFFMPWFNINLGEEFGRLTSELNQQMGQSPFGDMMPSNFSTSFSEGFQPTSALPVII